MTISSPDASGRVASASSTVTVIVPLSVVSVISVISSSGVMPITVASEPEAFSNDIPIRSVKDIIELELSGFVLMVSVVSEAVIVPLASNVTTSSY